MLDLCTASGDVVPHVLTKSKSHRVEYRQARKARLGEAWRWPLPVEDDLDELLD